MKPQKIGAGLLIPAFIVAVIAARMVSISVAYAGWAILAAVGIIDWYIIAEAKREGARAVTVTRYVRDLLPKRWDNIVMFAFIALVWWLTGPLYALFYVHGFLNDHFNEERR